MQISIFTILIASVHANKIIEEGFLLFFSKESEAGDIRLGFSWDRLDANDNLEILQYYASGACYFPLQKKFLKITTDGQMILHKRKYTKFFFMETADDLWVKKFTFNGDDKFQLCADMLVRYRSDCRVVKNIELRYRQDRLYITLAKYGSHEERGTSCV